MRSFEEVEQFLYSQLPVYQKIGGTAINYKLDKIIYLCEKLGNPHKKFKSIHIAGTNGKGSVSHYTASILQEAGYNIGLYTSPHLKRFTERIKINGTEIPQSEVVHFVTAHEALLEKEKPSFFEYTVLMAFDYFARMEVDVAVIEVGLGGRLDSTNILTPELSVITNIGLDHQYMLGDTIEKIAYEKAGIIKKGVPVVVGEKQPEILGVFLEQVVEKESNIIWASDEPLDKTDIPYQAINKRTSLVVANTLQEFGWKILPKHINDGIANVTLNTGFRGRWQVIHEKPLTICDTGHNVPGLKAVNDAFSRMTYSRLTCILGMMNDKDVANMLALFPNEAQFIFCQPNLPKAIDAHTLLEIAQQQMKTGRVIEDVNQAIEVAHHEAIDDELIFVGGSTFVVAEINSL